MPTENQPHYGEYNVTSGEQSPQFEHAPAIINPIKESLEVIHEAKKYKYTQLFKALDQKVYRQDMSRQEAEVYLQRIAPHYDTELGQEIRFTLEAEAREIMAIV